MLSCYLSFHDYRIVLSGNRLLPERDLLQYFKELRRCVSDPQKRLGQTNANLPGESVRHALLVKQLHVEIPNHRAQVLVLFGAEDLDGAVGSPHLQKGVGAVSFLGEREGGKVGFEIHRKAVVRLVDEQIVGHRSALVHQVFQPAHPRKFEITE